MTGHYERWGKSWEERHKEERKAYRAKWYQDNKLRISEQQKEYRCTSNRRYLKIIEDLAGESYEQDVQREG